MVDTDSPTLVEMLRENPIQSCLFITGTLVVAAVQLLNSFANDLSLIVSVPFAIVVLGFAALLLQYQLAQFQLTRLETNTVSQSAD